MLSLPRGVAELELTAKGRTFDAIGIQASQAVTTLYAFARQLLVEIARVEILFHVHHSSRVMAQAAAVCLQPSA